MSPGTISAAGISTCRPSRTTTARAGASCFSADRARSARNSWVKPMTALSTTITHDDHGVLDVADDAGNYRRRDQHEDHEVGELGEQHAEDISSTLLFDRVRSVMGKTLGGFGC